LFWKLLSKIKSLRYSLDRHRWEFTCDMDTAQMAALLKRAERAASWMQAEARTLNRREF